MSEAITGRCRDCVHFAVDAASPKKEGWGACLLADGESGEAEMSETLAFARDGEAYSAWLEVSPDFGCVQYEAKATA